MFFKYFLICGVLQQVLSQDLKDNCTFAEDDLERSAVHDLHMAKESCDETFGQCYSEANDDPETGNCNEEHNNCLNMIVDVYRDSIKDSDFSMKLYNEALSDIGDDCNGLCRYELVFMKLVEERVLCGLYRQLEI
ncbi:uncharacterized protein LOC119605778 [Lucilia sericata]|uniref:uncharacterized protein LOC119605778 n=1 Tax=Lucilia sericata TaxID=13632 RepID=UPI0018A8386A|nr:uncharacterized protein LOC119605778 [Lucilia sericata]